MGVLRPGRVAPRNQEVANDFGDHWSITQFGFEWLAKASLRPFLDMSRMSEVLAAFVPRFGAGFGQRAVEAVGTYRTANYLAACSMAGAAANQCSSLWRSRKAAMRQKCSRCMNWPVGEHASLRMSRGKRKNPSSASLKRRSIFFTIGAMTRHMVSKRQSRK